MNKLTQQELICGEMSAGRPSSRIRSSRANYWISPSSSRGQAPWIPPPAKSSGTTKMTWEGPTHRLEINPDPSRSTVLRVSDLNESDLESDHYEKKMNTLMAEVDRLKAEMEMQKSLRDLEEREAALKETQATLRTKAAELSSCQDQLLQSELEIMDVKERSKSLSRSVSPAANRPSRARARSASPYRVINFDYKQRSKSLETDQNRARLLAQLSEVEAHSGTVTRHANKLKTAIRRLQKDRRFASVHAADVKENKDIFLSSLSDFEEANRILTRLVQCQQREHATVGLLAEHCDKLEKKLVQSNSDKLILCEKLEKQDKHVLESHQLHDVIREKDAQIHSLNIQLQSVEDQLIKRGREVVQVQSELSEAKREKEQLRKSVRQYNQRIMEKEDMLEVITRELADKKKELIQNKGKQTSSEYEVESLKTELATLKATLCDVEGSLSAAAMSSKMHKDTFARQITDKTLELNTALLEMDKLRTIISSLEVRLRTNDSNSAAKIAELESEVMQLKECVSHNDELLSDYKDKLERSRVERMMANKEVKLKEQEIDALKQESLIATERSRLKMQQQMAELEPMPELLKSTEIRLSDAHERLKLHEKRVGDQTRLIAELTVKAEEAAASSEALRERLHEVAAEKRALESHLNSSEKRQQVTEQQNKELLSISGRKEDMVLRLQGRIEELVQEMATLSAQLETEKAAARRQADQIKERASGKDRANTARIADLECQLSRVNTLATQFRKSKEDMERRYHTRIQDMQEKLEQAISSRRSLENYITFLKSSYASVFNDSSHVPGPPPFTR